MRKASDRRFGETQNHTLYLITFAKNPTIYDINVEKMVESDGTQLAIECDACALRAG
jgi:hypothetical protein